MVRSAHSAHSAHVCSLIKALASAQMPSENAFMIANRYSKHSLPTFTVSNLGDLTKEPLLLFDQEELRLLPPIRKVYPAVTEACSLAHFTVCAVTVHNKMVIGFSYPNSAITREMAERVAAHIQNVFQVLCE